LVSGQLEGETLRWLWVHILLDQPLEPKTLILRHLAEFWMIEPEVAFNDLNDNMDLAEDFIHVIKYTLDKCRGGFEILRNTIYEENQNQAERSE
jgi:asparaginyl-tRNA synthetase